MKLSGFRPYMHESSRLLITFFSSMLLIAFTCKLSGQFDYIFYPVRYLNPSFINLRLLLDSDIPLFIATFYTAFALLLVFTFSYHMTFSIDKQSNSLSIDRFIEFIRISKLIVHAKNVDSVIIQNSSFYLLKLTKSTSFRILLSLSDGQKIPVTDWAFSTPKKAMFTAEDISSFFSCKIRRDIEVERSLASHTFRTLFILTISVLVSVTILNCLRLMAYNSNQSTAEALWNLSRSSRIPGGKIKIGSWTNSSYTGTITEGCFDATSKDIPWAALRLEWKPKDSGELTQTAKRVYRATKLLGKFEQEHLANNILIETWGNNNGCNSGKNLSFLILSGPQKHKIGMAHEWYCRITNRYFLLVCIQALGPHKLLEQYSRHLPTTDPCHENTRRITNGSS